MATLLDQIEAQALDSKTVKALRLCISLGGKADSAELRDWAIRELHGYDGVPDLPDYRRIRAHLYIDGVNAAWKIRGQQISSRQLPDFAREHISDQVEIRQSIPALQSMVDSAERTNEPICLSPPLAVEIAANMSEYGTQVTRLYWAVDPAALREITERVCTDVIAMVNEMRAGMGSAHKLPTPDLAAQAVEVVIHGSHNRVIMKDVGQSQDSPPVADDGGGSRLRNLWWIVGILGTIGGLVFGCVEIVA